MGKGYRTAHLAAIVNGLHDLNDPIHKVISHLQSHQCDPKSTGPGTWESRCPIHKGRKHNLSITATDDGTVLLHCHHVGENGSKTCDAATIVQTIGLSLSDLFPKHSGNGQPMALSKPTNKARKVKAYSSPELVVDHLIRQYGPPTRYLYPDDFIVFRFDFLDQDGKPDKTFRPVHCTADGWVSGDPPSLLPLYRRDDLPEEGRVVITEGEKACDEAVKIGLVATTTSHGAGNSHKTDLTPLAGREVVILPDNDDPGRGHQAKLARQLLKLNPTPTVKTLALEGLPVKGDIVDWVQSRPDRDMASLRAEIDRLADKAPLFQPEMEEKPKKTKGVWANFTAVITKEITRHEAGETIKVFEIKATRDDTIEKTITVPAAEFAGMRWVEQKLGAEWIVTAGREARDSLREQIATNSFGKITHETVHTALGWIDTTDGPLYLHAKGAIGAQGASNAVRVECSSALADYELPNPPQGQALQDAVAARFQIANLGPQAIAALLMTLPASVVVLGPLNFTIHFSGPTGTRKTSIALLAQGSFAHIPPMGLEKTATSWGATANGLQRLAYDCRDSLLVIDELTGEDAVKKATAFIQAQGNLKGRDRMTKDLKSAPGLDPRGGVLSTGETNPARNSALGRMLISPVTAGAINLDALTKCQEDIAVGLHRAATSAFLQWLAAPGRLAKVREALPGRIASFAKEIGLDAGGAHPRTPWALAQLMAGYEVWLQFARETGCITEEEAKRREAFAHVGLLSLLEEQKETNGKTTPAARFLDLLRSSILSGRYVLSDIKESAMDIPLGSQRIGYIDYDAGLIYLDPELAKEVARAKGQASGQPFENPESLARDLDAAGLLITSLEGGKRQLKRRKRIGTTNSRYLTLKKTSVWDDSDVPTQPRVGTLMNSE